MDVINLLPVIIIPLFVHAGLSFFQSVKNGPSQYDAILSIQINHLPSSSNVFTLLNHELEKNHQCRELFSCVLIWIQRLRIIGLIPLILYILCLFLIIFEFILIELVDINFIIMFFLGISILLQIIYLYFKLRSNIPSILLDLHAEYKNCNYLYILLDIAPIIKNKF